MRCETLTLLWSSTPFNFSWLEADTIFTGKPQQKSLITIGTHTHASLASKTFHAGRRVGQSCSRYHRDIFSTSAHHSLYPAYGLVLLQKFSPSPRLATQSTPVRLNDSELGTRRQHQSECESHGHGLHGWTIRILSSGLYLFAGPHALSHLHWHGRSGMYLDSTRAITPS